MKAGRQSCSRADEEQHPGLKIPPLSRGGQSPGERRGWKQQQQQQHEPQLQSLSHAQGGEKGGRERGRKEYWRRDRDVVRTGLVDEDVVPCSRQDNNLSVQRATSSSYRSLLVPAPSLLAPAPPAA